jgi:osmoprotectant transport system ATP-binding protein
VPMNEIRYDCVTKTYNNAEAPAVREISLTVLQERFVVFLGPSGCGKTTLLKMTNRLIEPDSGTIYLDGVDIRQLPVTQLRRRMGYVIQQVGLFPHMTVAQNVAVVPELLGWPKKQIIARVDELLDLVKLPPDTFRGRYPAQLSGGQQQRVGLARALAGDPELLLMDEPFGAIDAITRASLQDEIRELHQRLKKTILFVTHDVNEALRLADEIVVLRAGEVAQYGSPCELLSNPANTFVSELMGADDRVRQLSLLRVDTIMAPLPPGQAAGAPDPRLTLSAAASVSEALSLLLRPGVERIFVEVDGKPAGQLSLEQIRSARCGGADE